MPPLTQHKSPHGEHSRIVQNRATQKVGTYSLRSDLDVARQPHHRQEGWEPCFPFCARMHAPRLKTVLPARFLNREKTAEALHAQCLH